MDLVNRRFSHPLVLTSGSGRHNNLFRGYVTKTVSSSMVMEMYDPSNQPQGSQFGQWVIPRDGENWSPVSKMTVDNNQKYGATRYETLLRKLWLSAILRDNIVTSLGYVLYRPDNVLPEPLYTSLNMIYNHVRLRRIHTTEYVYILNEMSNAPPQTQFLILFEELQKRLPKYLKSTAEVWVEALSQNQINLTEIIRPNGGPVVVDLLATIQPSALEVLNEDVMFQKNTIKNSSQDVKDMMGEFFSYVFSGIKDGTIKLTQQLFAVILLHLPLDRIVPQADEIERYLVDALRVESFTHWDELISKIGPEYFICPCVLSREILSKIAEDPDIDDQLRRDAIYLKPFINFPSNTFTNTYYGTMSKVIGLPTIQYKQLLKHIAPEDYSHEVVLLKNRFIYYVTHGYINMDLVITGFIRHDYTDPVDLLIAMLTRIVQRQSFLSDEILSTVKAFQQALIFKNLVCSASPVVPDGFIYIPAMAEAFDTPDMPEDIREIGRSLSQTLMDTNFGWDVLVNNTSIEKCIVPKQCFITLMNEAVKYLPDNSSAISYFEELLLMVDSNGTLENDGISQCETPLTDLSNTTNNKTRGEGRTAIFPSNTRKPNDQEFEDVSDESISETTTFPDDESSEIISPDVEFPPFSLNMYYIPTTFEQRDQLLPPTVPLSSEDRLLKPIRNFILREDLLDILGEDFDPNKYTNKVWMLRGILETAVDSDLVKEEESLHKLLSRYLNYLIHDMEARKLEINFQTLLESLPHATNGTEFKYFQVLRDFFLSGKVKPLTVDFDFFKFNTRGALLKGLFSNLLSNEQLNETLLYEAITYYFNKVYLDGFGAKSIEYTIVRQITRRITINLQATFQAIDTINLDKAAKEALKDVYTFFGKEFDPPIHISDFDIMDYNTKGEWLQAFFKHLIRHPAVSNESKKNLQTILPHVLLTGPGAEPIEKINIRRST